MHVIHTIGELHPRLGGPVRTVSRLAESLAADGAFKVSLLSQGLFGNAVVQLSETSLDRRLAISRLRGALRAGLPLRKLVIDAVCVSPPVLIHDHGLWTPANHFVVSTARDLHIPLVIHPRGMLEPWALKYRAWKKQLALHLYQRRDLETATLFIATAAQEAESVRRLGLRQPVAIIPNGVDMPIFRRSGVQTGSFPDSPHTAIFLSRIHPKKGLPNLIEAWGRLRPKHWRLRVAGPDEGAHLAEVMQRIRRLGLEDSVEYVGEVDGETKAALFESADLFLLPSFSENFGVVIAESLAYGVPVITTRGTPWEGLMHHGCGWWIEPTVDALTEALSEALSMDSATLKAMGEKGRTYAGEFGWMQIAQQTADVYRWVLGLGPMPDCVVTD